METDEAFKLKQIEKICERRKNRPSSPLARLIQKKSVVYLLGKNSSCSSLINIQNIDQNSLIYEFRESDLINKTILNNLKEVLTHLSGRAISKVYVESPHCGTFYVIPKTEWGHAFSSPQCILIPLEQFQCNVGTVVDKTKMQAKFDLFIGWKKNKEEYYTKVKFNNDIISWTDTMINWIIDIQAVITRVTVR